MYRIIKRDDGKYYVQQRFLWLFWWDMATLDDHSGHGTLPEAQESLRLLES